MLNQYFEAAMKAAHFEIMEDGRYFGEIPPMAGVWAEGDTLAACRDRLFEVMEEWTLMAYWLHSPLPIIDDIDANLKMEPEPNADEKTELDPQAAQLGIPRAIQRSETSLHGKG